MKNAGAWLFFLIVIPVCFSGLLTAILPIILIAIVPAIILGIIIAIFEAFGAFKRT